MTEVSKKESLLVVEENEVIQSLFQETFQRKGYQVYQASGPEIGFEIYKATYPDLVLSNIEFKGASGFNFLAELKDIDPDVALIILSRHVDHEIAQRVIAYGIYDLIPIPFELDQIVASVRRALEKKMLLERNQTLIEKQAALIERLHASYKQLKELDKLKNDFLINISHELLTPLTSIKAITYNLLKGVTGPLDAKKKEYAEIIKEDAERLEEILTEILNLSRLEAGEISLKRESVDIEAMISRCVRMMNPVASEKGITLTADGIDFLPKVVCDKSRIEEVLANLVENAIKYTPSGGRIIVSSRSENNLVSVSVKDTGVGIPEEHVDKVFSRFIQFHRVDGPGAKGVGLGLAIVKKVIDMHAGRITVESKVGKGTTFTFILPVNETAPAKLGDILDGNTIE